MEIPQMLTIHRISSVCGTAPATFPYVLQPPPEVAKASQTRLDQPELSGGAITHFDTTFEANSVPGLGSDSLKQQKVQV